MADQAHTAVPPQNAFPPFDTSTYPDQLFWLAITFTALFLILWRLAGPTIAGVIGERKGRIDDDLAHAGKHKEDAEAALAAYQAALDKAHKNAHALADDSRKQAAGEIEKAKEEADRLGREATEAAESRIAEIRAQASQHVTKAAQDAAASIVARLIGAKVSPEEAEAAVKSGVGV